MKALDVEEVKGFLRQRLGQIEAILEHLQVHQAEQMAHDEVPRLAAAVFDHSQAHFEAELAWTRDLLDKVERGIYP